MADVNTRPGSTASQQTTDYDYSEIFLGCNTFDELTYTNSTLAEVTLNAGTVMGKIAATGLALPLDSGAGDGSQFPIGILASPVVVAAGASANISVCVEGDVAEEMLIYFNGSDDGTTVVSGRQLRDRIGSDTVGVKLYGAISPTKFDN